MKWVSKIQSKPKIDDRRWVMKFAFLPTYAWSHSDRVRYNIWLMYYKQEQVYKTMVHEYVTGVGPIPIDEWVEVQNTIP